MSGCVGHSRAARLGVLALVLVCGIAVGRAGNVSKNVPHVDENPEDSQCANLIRRSGMSSAAFKPISEMILFWIFVERKADAKTWEKKKRGGLYSEQQRRAAKEQCGNTQLWLPFVMCGMTSRDTLLKGEVDELYFNWRYQPIEALRTRLLRPEGGPEVMRLELDHTVAGRPGAGLTHDFVIQRASSTEFYLWQSYVGEYTLWDWIQQDPKRPSAYAGRLGVAQLNDFLDKLGSLLEMADTEANRAGWRVAYDGLFWTRKTADGPVPTLQLKFMTTPYREAACESNLRELGVLAEKTFALEKAAKTALRSSTKDGMLSLQADLLRLKVASMDVMSGAEQGGAEQGGDVETGADIGAGHGA